MSQTFCIIEDPINKHQILSILLSIEQIEPNCNCVICCCQQTKEYLNCFPKTFNVNLTLVDFHNIYAHFDVIASIKNTISSIKYCLDNFDEVIVLNQTAIMINKLIISDEIKKQGYAFIKKKQHDAVNENLNYSFDMYYLNNSTYLDYVTSLINDLKIIDGNIEDYEDYKYDLVEQKKLTYFYRILPSKLSKLTDIYFNEETILASEDFFRYSDSIKLDDIKKDFILNDKPISFLQIRYNGKSPIKDVEEHLLNGLCKYKPNYYSLISLQTLQKKMIFNIPLLDNIGIWERKNNDALKSVIDKICDKYGDYFSSKSKNKEYYSFGSYIIFDKPNYNWINNSVKQFTHIRLTNYDNSVIETLKKNNIYFNFLGFLGLYPLILFEFIENIKDENEKGLLFVSDYCPNDETEYKEFLNEISKVKFCKFKYFNIQLISSALALNVIPIFTSDNKILNLEKNVHYLDNDINLENIDSNSMIENIKNNKLIIRKLSDFINNLF